MPITLEMLFEKGIVDNFKMEEHFAVEVDEDIFLSSIRGSSDLSRQHGCS